MHVYCEICGHYRVAEMRGGQLICRPCAEAMDAEHDAAYQRDRDAALREDDDRRREDKPNASGQPRLARRETT
jgi:hypothetical protein